MLSDVANFLYSYRWIFDFKWTEFFIVKPWISMPHDWNKVLTDANFSDLQKALRLDESGSSLHLHWPESLLQLLKFSQRLSPFISVSYSGTKNEVSSPGLPGTMATSLSQSECRGLTPKKRHEISRLLDVFSSTSVRRVVDLGSGLGHLPRLLAARHSQLEVICVEADSSLHSRAAGDETVSNLSKLHFRLERDNFSQFEELIGGGENCLLSLHGCGDLTPNALRYFLHSKATRWALLISCCYHKMKSASDNFPMSVAGLKLSNSVVAEVFNVPALRLACQETAHKWASWTDDDFHRHQNFVLARGVLELAYFHGKIATTGDKAFRRGNPNKFHSVRHFLSSLQLQESSDILEIEAQVTQDHLIQYIEPFLMLQMALQPVLEFFLLFDRVILLREAAGVSAQLVRLFDPALSPRGLAILAKKSV